MNRSTKNECSFGFFYSLKGGMLDKGSFLKVQHGTKLNKCSKIVLRYAIFEGNSFPARSFLCLRLCMVGKTWLSFSQFLLDLVSFICFVNSSNNRKHCFFVLFFEFFLYFFCYFFTLFWKHTQLIEILGSHSLRLNMFDKIRIFFYYW